MLKYQINQGVVMQANIKQKCHSTGIFMNFKSRKIHLNVCTYAPLWCGCSGGLTPNPQTKLLPASPSA